MNNYGVWADEFAELGLDGTLDQRWPDAHCWFGEQYEVRVGRAYGRCCSNPAESAQVVSRVLCLMLKNDARVHELILFMRWKQEGRAACGSHPRSLLRVSVRPLKRGT